MRLIDSDALKMAFRTEKGAYVLRHAICNLFGMDEIVDEQPTIEAEPVVHGRCNWCNGDYHTKIMATAIRYHSNGNMDGYELKVNFCPNCGAKMDGERKSNG